MLRRRSEEEMEQLEQLIPLVKMTSNFAQFFVKFRAHLYHDWAVH